MSLAQDLLEQAHHLSQRERGRPRQASLRRAISAAYYAIFHLIVQEGTGILVSRPELRAKFARAFDHGDMRHASQAFANAHAAQLPTLTGGAAISADLRDVAAAFVELQEARHDADYNIEKSFTRLQCSTLVGRASAAFEKWQRIRNDPVARTYLATMLLWKRWRR